MDEITEVYFLHNNWCRNWGFQSLFLTQQLQKLRFVSYFSTTLDMLAMSPHSHNMAATAPGIMSSHNHLHRKLGWEASLHTLFLIQEEKILQKPQEQTSLISHWPELGHWSCLNQSLSSKVPLTKAKTWMRVGKQPTRSATLHVRYPIQLLFPSRV